MADDSIFEGILADMVPQKSGAVADTLGKAIIREADRLGIAPIDLATVMSYETSGTFNPNIKGGKGGKYLGLIQFGPEEQKKYGITPGMSVDDQVRAAGDYLIDRGLQPGMGLLDLYSTINAGKPGLYNASDKPGETVQTHVEKMGPHVDNAKALLAGMIEDPTGMAGDWEKGLTEIPDLTGPAVGGEGFKPSASWSTGADFANKLLLGAGTPIMAATQAAKTLASGGSLEDAGDTFSQARGAYDAAQEQWAKENPGTDLVNMLFGAVPTTLATMAVTRGKAGPLIESAATSMSPRLGPPVVNFLAGQAGRDAPGVGGFALRTASRIAEGALEGAGAGALQGGLTDEPLGVDTLAGTALGAIVNPVLKPIMPSLGNLFKAEVTPALAKTFQKAKALGINLTGPQITLNPFIRETGKKAGAMGSEEQLAQYTKAVGKEFGENSPVLTQDVMESAERRLGKGFDGIATGVNDLGDKAFQQRLISLRTQALNELGGDPKNATYQLINSYIGQLGRMAQRGHLNGETYKTLVRSSSGINRNLTKSTDANLRYYGGQIIEAMHDALGRNAPAGTKEAFKTLRQQWAAMKQVEPIAEKSWPSGVLDPQKMASLRGSKTGNLSDLAEIGQLLPRSTPQGGAKLSGEGMPSLQKLVAIVAGAGAAGGAGLEGAPQIANAIAANPLLAAAGGTLLGGKLAINKYIQSLMRDPKYAEILAAKGLGQGPMGMPFTAQAIDTLSNLAIPTGVAIENQ